MPKNITLLDKVSHLLMLLSLVIEWGVLTNRCSPKTDSVFSLTMTWVNH